MKKSFLLSVLAGGILLSSASVVFGQQTQRIPVPVNTLPNTSRVYSTLPKFIPSSPDESIPRALISPSAISKTQKNSTTAAKVMATPPGKMVGYTYYDFQTNGSMMDRLAYSTDGTDKYIQFFWMASKDSTKGTSGGTNPVFISGFNDQRGAHYALVSVSTPTAPESLLDGWKKMAAEKTSAGAPERHGWPSVVQFKDGTIGTATHAPVDFFSNSSFGDETFKRYTADNTSSTSNPSTWPRSVADGKDNVHLIYTFAPSTTADPAPQNAYRRSTDKGKTWSSEILLTGASAFDGTSLNGGGGDTYAIAARDNVVSIVYATNPPDRIFFRKSIDNGATWSKPTVILAPQYVNLDTVKDAFSDNYFIHTDTARTYGPQMDIIIDSEGKTHIVVNEILSALKHVVSKSGDTYTRVADTIFYEDELDAYRTKNIGMTYYKEGDDYSYFIARPSSINWDGKGQIIGRRAHSGLSRYPQLGLDADDNVYLTYSSIVNGDSKPIMLDTNATPDGKGDMQVDGLMGHIYATHKLKNNPNWSAPNDLTPAGVDCLFGTLCNDVVNGQMYIAYSADNTPGDRVTNTELPIEQTGIYVYPFPIASLNQVGVEEGQVPEETLQLEALPNPTTGTTVFSFGVPQAGNATLTLHNALGMNVATLYNGSVAAGGHSVTYDTQSLSSGAYYFTLEINGHKLTKMVSVVK